MKTYTETIILERVMEGVINRLDLQGIHNSFNRNHQAYMDTLERLEEQSKELIKNLKNLDK